jgi:hypothetical protein
MRWEKLGRVASLEPGLELRGQERRQLTPFRSRFTRPELDEVIGDRLDDDGPATLG